MCHYVSKKVSKPGFTRKLKTGVKDRDDRQCRTCGSRDNLTVHHIDGDRANNDAMNLITLCQTCHRKIHSRYATRKERKRIKTITVCASCHTVQYNEYIESPDYISIFLTSH